MKKTTLRMLLGLSVLVVAGACSTETPPLPTEPKREEPPPPPSTGFRTVATPAIYA
jgi:hypothetical protein